MIAAAAPLSIAILLAAAKVALVLLAAWIALRLLARASAATRHRVIVLAFLGALALPLLSPVLPAWRGLPALGGPAPAAPAGEIAPASAADLAAAADLLSAPALASAPAPATAVPEARPASVWRAVTPGRAILLLWAAGAAALLLVLAARVASLHLAARRAEPIADPAWQRLVADLGRRLGVERPIAVRAYGEGRMPLAWGALRPTVLLPAECRSWPAERRRAVLAHEIAHIARGDVPALLLGQLVCALHWFNPLAWALRRRLAVERELACDDVVLAQGVAPARYAHHLLTIAGDCRRPPRLPAVTAASSQLEGRIMAILDPRRNRQGLARRAERALVLVLVLALVPLASLTWGEASAGAAQVQAFGESDSADFGAELRMHGVDLANVDALLAGLDATSATRRAASAWALGQSGDERAVEPLIAGLGDREPKVREWSARSLAELGDRRAVVPLIDRLDDGDAEVRQWAARGLGSLGDERAVQPLLYAIDDQDPEVRQWVVRALGDLGVTDAKQALIARLADDDAEVAEWAARSLAELGREDRPELPWRRTGEESLMPALASAPPAPGDPESIAALIGSLDSREANVREWAARSLATLGARDAVAPLIAQIGDEDAAVREWAIRALGTIRDPRAVEPLLAALDDDSPDVRQWAVRSLGVLADGRMVEPLFARLADGDVEVREWAVRALGAHGDPRAVGPLTGALADESPTVRRWAEKALANLGATT